MIFLIDTTTGPTTIGLWNGEKLFTKVIESNPENNRKLISIIEKFGDSLKTFLPVSKVENWKLEIESVGVICGPGTFTGVRTGVTIANTIGYALKIPLYSIDTLSAQIPVGTNSRSSINNAVSLLSASNTEVFFARFLKGKMIGKIEIVNVINNLANRIKKEDLIVGDLQEKHCGIWSANEFQKVGSKERIERLLQMIINKKVGPVKQALPLYIKKPNITKKKNKPAFPK